jgi:hypothetical protein
MLAARLGLALVPLTAHTATFADPGARVVTLDRGHVTAVAALPGGDVVFAVGGRIERLTADGHRFRVRADGADALAAESEQTVLRVPESGRGIERVDVRTGALTPLPALPANPEIDALTVLADGTVIAATFERPFAIAPGGQVTTLEGGSIVTELAPLGTRFVFLGTDGLAVQALTGAPQTLAAGPLSGPLAASGDGAVLALAYLQPTVDQREDEPARGKCSRFAPPSCTDWSGSYSLTVTRVGADGTQTPMLALPARPASATGDGDGLALFSEPFLSEETGRLALADDGSLVFTDISGHLRALVPPDSPRPRIALTGFGAGVHYAASAPGTVSVTVRGRKDFQASGSGGEVRLPSAPPPGRYVVRLRLTTLTGGTAETVQRVDTRPVLPLRDARSALHTAYEDSHGDEGGGDRTQLGDCARRSAREVRCGLLYQEIIQQFDGPHEGSYDIYGIPAASVTARLLADGIHTRSRLLAHGYDPPKHCLRATARGLTMRIRARCTVRVRVAAHLRWHGGRATPAVTRRLHRGESWTAVLRVPRGASGRVTGDIVATTKLEEHGAPV